MSLTQLQLSAKPDFGLYALDGKVPSSQRTYSTIAHTDPLDTSNTMDRHNIDSMASLKMFQNAKQVQNSRFDESQQDDSAIIAEPSNTFGSSSDSLGAGIGQQDAAVIRYYPLPRPIFTREEGYFERAREMGVVARKVTPDQGKARFECPVCKQTYGTRHAVATHCVSHTGEYPYKCHVPRCGRRFQYHGTARYHYDTHVKKKEIVHVPSVGMAVRKVMPPHHVVQNSDYSSQIPPPAVGPSIDGYEGQKKRSFAQSNNNVVPALERSMKVPRVMTNINRRHEFNDSRPNDDIQTVTNRKGGNSKASKFMKYRTNARKTTVAVARDIGKDPEELEDALKTILEATTEQIEEAVAAVQPALSESLKNFSFPSLEEPWTSL